MLPVLALSLYAAVAAGLALLLRRRWPGWRAPRLALTAAAPLPLAVLVFCAWIAVDVAMTPDDKCGVDACAMAMAGAFFIGSSAFVAWALGTAASLFLMRVVRA